MFDLNSVFVGSVFKYQDDIGVSEAIVMQIYSHKNKRYGFIDSNNRVWIGNKHGKWEIVND